MKTLMNFTCAALAATAVVFSFSASAQTMNSDIKNPSPNSGYVQDTNGNIVRDTYGLCVHTGFWTQANAVVVGCDGVEAPKSAPAPMVEAPAAPVVAPVVAAPAAPVAPAPTSEKVTFAADALFDFDKSVLKPEGKSKLTELATKLKDINLEAVVATGHTDSVGKSEYNQKLSVRRAESVKAYLVSNGVAADRIYISGKGETQPVADNKTKEGREKNRRVEIEVVGTRAIKK